MGKSPNQRRTSSGSPNRNSFTSSRFVPSMTGTSLYLPVAKSPSGSSSGMTAPSRITVGSR